MYLPIGSMLLHGLRISRCGRKIDEEPEEARRFGIMSTIPWRNIRMIEEEEARREDEETSDDVVLEEDQNDLTLNIILDSP